MEDADKIRNMMQYNTELVRIIKKTTSVIVIGLESVSQVC